MRTVVYLLVGIVITSLVMRTFLAAGLVEPVRVQGSSMAPHFWGDRAAFRCTACGREIEIGVDQLPQRDASRCPRCGALGLQADSARAIQGQSLWIDRTGLHPKRFDSVVLRYPLDARTLLIKRAVGLPGELVEFKEGDLWINGDRYKKSLRDQFAVRLLEHEEVRPERWRPLVGDWRMGDAWWASAASDDAPSSLVYAHPITDDFAPNLRATRRINIQPDRMLEVESRGSADAVWRISLGGAEATLDASRGTLTLKVGAQSKSARLPDPRHVLLSVFDHQAVLTASERESLVLPIESLEASEPAVTVARGSLRLERLTLWKDLYYEAIPSAQNLPQPAASRLGADEYFVVGDNQAISVDSRTWRAGAGVPRRLLLGKPLNSR